MTIKELLILTIDKVFGDMPEISFSPSERADKVNKALCLILEADFNNRSIGFMPPFKLVERKHIYIPKGYSDPLKYKIRKFPPKEGNLIK